MIDWIKNRKLNTTSAFFVGISYTIAIFYPYFYMLLIPDKDILNNVGDNIMTILIPTFINLLIIPAFKIVSFYQNIDVKIIKDEVTDEKIKYYNEKQIVYTEALLTCTTALPIFLLYVYQGTYILSQKQPVLTLCLTLIITIILAIIGVRVLIKKFRRVLSKKFRR